MDLTSSSHSDSSSHPDRTSVGTHSSEEDEGRCRKERGSSDDSCDSITNSNNGSKRIKKTSFLRKPRDVCYTCSNCNKSYTYTVFDNPWYSIVKHKCPVCKLEQVPALDISTKFNAIELDPSFAILLDDASDANSDSSIIDQSENDNTNSDIAPAQLNCNDVCKLLSLFIHSKTCMIQHSNSEHQMICRSAKSLVEHIKTCSTNQNYCSYPWCQPMKYLLLHLMNCTNQMPDPNICQVCADWNGNHNFKEIRHVFSNLFLNL